MKFRENSTLLRHFSHPISVQIDWKIWSNECFVVPQQLHMLSEEGAEIETSRRDKIKSDLSADLFRFNGSRLRPSAIAPDWLWRHAREVAITHRHLSRRNDELNYSQINQQNNRIRLLFSLSFFFGAPTLFFRLVCVLMLQFSKNLIQMKKHLLYCSQWRYLAGSVHENVIFIERFVTQPSIVSIHWIHREF